jgi:hypothetical protein
MTTIIIDDKYREIAALETKIRETVTDMPEMATDSEVAAAVANASGASLTDYANVVVVDPDGKGDYTTLAAAFAGITDAASNKRYTIYVYGTTVETANVVAKRYINVVGGEITTSNGSQVQVPPGAVDDSNWYNCRITCAVATTAGSARATFWSCNLTGGLADANGAWQCYFRNCKVAGTWPTVGASSVFDFSNCEVTLAVTVNLIVATVNLRNCNTTLSGPGILSVGNGKTLSFYGGMVFGTNATLTTTHSAGAINVFDVESMSIAGFGGASGTITVRNSYVNLGVSGYIDLANPYTLSVFNSLIENAATGGTQTRLLSYSFATLLLHNSTVRNRTTNGSAMMVEDTPGTCSIVNSVLLGNGSGNGIDGLSSYTLSVCNSVVAPFSASLVTLSSGTVEGSNVVSF